MFSVYSPSRFSYFHWTPVRQMNELMPAPGFEAMDRRHAEELAAKLGDGVVAPVRTEKPTEVEPVADYW